MPEVEKQIVFNAFHICLLVVVINLLMNGDRDYIINLINYLINMEAQGFWFIILHIIIVYVLLSNLRFELGFHASIKFNI